MQEQQDQKVNDYYKLIGQQNRRVSAKDLKVQPKNQMMQKINKPTSAIKAMENQDDDPLEEESDDEI